MCSNASVYPQFCKTFQMLSYDPFETLTLVNQDERSNRGAYVSYGARVGS